MLLNGLNAIYVVILFASFFLDKFNFKNIVALVVLSLLLLNWFIDNLKAKLSLFPLDKEYSYNRFLVIYGLLHPIFISFLVVFAFYSEFVAENTPLNLVALGCSFIALVLLTLFSEDEYKNIRDYQVVSSLHDGQR